MNFWQSTPPTYQQWKESTSNGFWWVKFMLTPREVETDDDGEEIVWPETWYTDVVQLAASYDSFEDIFDKDRVGKLHARGGMVLKNFDLDDAEATKDMYWQPVVPPFDDEKDKRPEV